MLLITFLDQEVNEEDFDGDDANDKVNEDLFFFTIIPPLWRLIGHFKVISCIKSHAKILFLSLRAFLFF